MKASDYIVKYLESEGIRDVFGIPGVGCGHFVNSLRHSGIRNHLMYHEQGAAFAACAYGQASKKIGVAYATAGPGATNLLTGIANAYVDSAPSLYVVGDKDQDTLKGDMKIRQRASQEIDIVSMAKPVTKMSVQIKNVDELPDLLHKAIKVATSDRPGPVLLDIPSDIQRAELLMDEVRKYDPDVTQDYHAEVDLIISTIETAKRPLLLVGNGVKQAGLMDYVHRISINYDLPLVATVACEDETFFFDNYIGFIGIDGEKAANTALNQCDVLVTMGARLNIKQVGNKRTNFAKQASIIRIDIDEEELKYKVRDEQSVVADLKFLLPELVKASESKHQNTEWVEKCRNSRKDNACAPSANKVGDGIMQELCYALPENIGITLGIGSHRRWFVRQGIVKKNWEIYQSGAFASMGYSLPAAIGVYWATGKPVVCIDGDGGSMMNLQELQTIKRDNLPITICLFNNHCLGDIMEFQKKVFDKNYMATTEDSGYLAADFESIAKSFGLKYFKADENDITRLFDMDTSKLIEFVIPSNE